MTPWSPWESYQRGRQFSFHPGASTQPTSTCTQPVRYFVFKPLGCEMHKPTPAVKCSSAVKCTMGTTCFISGTGHGLWISKTDIVQHSTLCEHTTINRQATKRLRISPAGTGVLGQAISWQKSAPESGKAVVTVAAELAHPGAEATC